MRLVRISILGAALLASAAVAQEERAVFDAAVVELGDQDRVNRLLDVDGDGDLDGVGYWWVTDVEYRLAVYLNREGLGFGRVWARSFDGPLEDDRLPLDAGTFDGMPGFAVGHRGGEVDLFLFDGGVTPALRATWSHPDIRDLCAADFDGDGSDDVAVLDGETLVLHLSSGGTAETAVDPRARILRADLDLDGSSDLVLWDETAIDLCPVIGGVPQTGERFDTPFPTGALTAGDVDGDADHDLVFFEAPGGGEPRYQVLRQIEPGLFVPEPPRDGGPATDLADVDGDGDLDGVCCGGGGGGGGGGGDPPPPPPPDPRFNEGASIFRISCNDGFGGFGPAMTIEGIGASHLAGAADIDADGDADLVAGRAVYYGHASAYEPRPTVPYQGAVHPVDVTDLDDDADPDLFFGTEGTAYHAGRGDGSFEARSLQAPEAPPGSAFDVEDAFPGDWNGDGSTDLVVIHRSGETFVGMRLLANLGDGRLADAGEAGEPGVPFVTVDQCGTCDLRRFFAADVDDDGDLDFCAVRPGSIQFVGKVWKNDGTGFFAQSESLQFNEGYVVSAADFDGDGITDVVTLRPDFTTYPFHLRRGNGDGTFRPAVEIGRMDGTAFRTPTVADLDDDGDLDFAFVTASDSVFFELNDGTGRFTPFAFPGATPWNLSRVHAADLNHDGRTDVVLASLGENHDLSSVYLREATGLVYEEVRVVIDPRRLLDADGDGDLDALHRSIAPSAHVTVRNRAFVPASDGSRRQYGAGHPGAGGVIPVLGVEGTLRPGGAVRFLLRAGRGGADAILFGGSAPLDKPKLGGTILARPDTRVPVRLLGEPGAPGAGRRDLRFTEPRPSWIGKTFFLQYAVFDPEASQGVSLSNGLEVTFGG